MRRLLAHAVVSSVLAASTGAAEPKDPREAEVRRLIERYFLSWSNQDLERYGQCFLPHAAVQLLDANGAAHDAAAGTVPAEPAAKRIGRLSTG